MNHAELSSYLNDLTQKVLADNIAQITEFLFASVNFSESPKEIIPQAFLASTTLATRLSTEITLTILNQIEAIDFETLKYEMPRPELKVIIGGLTKEAKHED